ncbi:MAG TPA: hypothetical protein DCR95_09835 [Desulfobacter sp.]|nr:hypothetical protein [Desulfobacter sp.]
MVKQGTFREDLYYRLNVFTITFPPLRERREDIPLLARHFLEQTDHKARLSPQSMQLLTSYSWPGNIRELQNALLRFFSTGEFEILNMTVKPIQSDHFKRSIPPGDTTNDLSHAIKTVEKEQIINALQSTNWHRSCAAAKLGISRSTLFRRMKKHGLKLKQNVRY